VFGKPGGGGDEGFGPEQGPVPVGFLGSLLIGMDEDFIIPGDPGIEAQPEAGHLRFREALQIRQTDPQAYFGIKFVDVLPAGAAGSGKG
jgi:hypothetical protein